VAGNQLVAVLRQLQSMAKRWVRQGGAPKATRALYSCPASTRGLLAGQSPALASAVVAGFTYAACTAPTAGGTSCSCRRTTATRRWRRC
jgi:hypothetical protein